MVWAMKVEKEKTAVACLADYQASDWPLALALLRSRQWLVVPGSAGTRA